MANQINDCDLEARLAESNNFVCIAFLQCGPENMRFLREFESAAMQLPANIEFYWINATENPSVARNYNLKITPTTILYICSDEVARYQGFYDAGFLAKQIGEWTRKRRCP